jgi:hypothetical protein
MVRKPPAWNAARGSNDSPNMTQKIASAANPHARNTISNAIRRRSSTFRRSADAACLRRVRLKGRSGTYFLFRRRTIGSQKLYDLFVGLAKTLQADLQEIADRRKRQQRRSGKPDPHRDLGRILPGADDVFVDRRRRG